MENINYNDPRIVYDCVKMLADLDIDEATEINGQGYNKMDGKFARSLLSREWERWTDKQKIAAFNMLYKYRQQLRNRGIFYENIPRPKVNVIKYDNEGQTARSATEDRPVQKKEEWIPKKWIELDKNETRIEIEWKCLPKTEWGAIHNEVRLLPGRQMENVGGVRDPEDKYGWIVKPERTFWWVPLNPNTAKLVMELAKKYKFRSKHETIVKITEMAQAGEVLVNLSNAAEAEALEIPGFGNPEKNLMLRPFQAVGVRYGVIAKRFGFFDEMGIGKTIQALATIWKLQSVPCLIVVPKVVVINWKREIQRWIPSARVMIVNSKTKAEEIQFGHPDFVLLNYDILYKLEAELSRIVWAAVIYDEAHRLKNPGSLRSRAAKAIVKEVPIRLLLTGTPIVNRVHELVSLLKLMGQFNALFGSEQKFNYQYFFNGQLQNTDELHKLLMSTCMVRRTKAQVLTELPPIDRSVIPFELDNRKDYEFAEQNIIQWVGQQAEHDRKFLATIAHLSQEEQAKAIRQYRNSKEQKARRAEALVRMEKLKQLCAKGKWKQFVQWADEFLLTGEKLIIFSTHTETQEWIQKKWPKAVRILGGMSDKDRQAAIDAFQNDPEAMIANCAIRAAGEGITLTASSHVAFMELDWTPKDHDQAESRAHRMGQRDNVTVYYFIGLDTIEQFITEKLDEKRLTAKSVIDGEDGLSEGESIQEMVVKWLETRGNHTHFSELGLEETEDPEPEKEEEHW